MTSKTRPPTEIASFAPNPGPDAIRAIPVNADVKRSVQRRVSALIERIPIERLKALVLEDDWTLISGLANPEVLAASRPTAHDEARQRGHAFKKKLLDENPTWSAVEVARHKAVKEESLTKRINRGTLIAVMANGELRFPTFQFDDDHSSGELPGVSEALAEMQLDSPWIRFSWFVTKNERLMGDSPVQALKSGRKEAVILAARGVGVQGGA